MSEPGAAVPPAAASTAVAPASKEPKLPGMKLGACYNIFDAEELLESSIVSVLPNVDYVCVVYQTTSNWGEKCNPGLVDLLEALQKRGLIDELVFYEPREFSREERIALVSRRARPQEMGTTPDNVGPQFFNELTKREIGRQKCMENGCTHFMSMDSDEYYLEDELRKAKEIILEHGYDATACKMRIVFKEPIWEFWPLDENNSVPLIYELPRDPTEEGRDFKICAPYPALLDPTRRIDTYDKFHMFDRGEVEMWHLSFVRRSMRKKLANVSNRANYLSTDLEDFLVRFEAWRGPEDGLLHPHPSIGQLFREMRRVPNHFKVDIHGLCDYCLISPASSPLAFAAAAVTGTQPPASDPDAPPSTTVGGDLRRCSQCRAVLYCCEGHQRLDWPAHRAICKTVALAAAGNKPS